MRTTTLLTHLCVTFPFISKPRALYVFCTRGSFLHIALPVALCPKFSAVFTTPCCVLFFAHGALGLIFKIRRRTGRRFFFARNFTRLGDFCLQVRRRTDRRFFFRTQLDALVDVWFEVRRRTHHWFFFHMQLHAACGLLVRGPAQDRPLVFFTDHLFFFTRNLTRARGLLVRGPAQDRPLVFFSHAT